MSTKGFFFILFLTGVVKYCVAQDTIHPKITEKGRNVSITYKQPSKSGRAIFGSLIPYGKVWRTGADEATEIRFDEDMIFGTDTVKKGTYTLFTIPDSTEWTLVLNPVLKQWGAYGYDKVKDRDLRHVKAKPTKLRVPAEKLRLRFDDQNDLVIEWGVTRVSVPIRRVKRK